MPRPLSVLRALGPLAVTLLLGCAADPQPADVAAPDLGPAEVQPTDAVAEVVFTEDAPGPLEDASETIEDAGVEEVGPAPRLARDARASDAEASDIFRPDTGGPCDPISGNGCEPLQTCTFTSRDATEPTCEYAGPAVLGEPCEAAAGCATGVCLALNGAPSTCHAVCATDGDCPDGAPCVAPDGVAFSICEQWDIFEPCVLLDAQSCPAGLGCYLVGGQTEPVCLAPGPGAPGEGCDTANGCQASAACVEGVCHALCDPAGPEPCAAAEQPCHPYYQGAGICAQ